MRSSALHHIHRFTNVCAQSVRGILESIQQNQLDNLEVLADRQFDALFGQVVVDPYRPDSRVDRFERLRQRVVTCRSKQRHVEVLIHHDEVGGGLGPVMPEFAPLHPQGLQGSEVVTDAGCLDCAGDTTQLQCGTEFVQIAQAGEVRNGDVVPALDAGDEAVGEQAAHGFADGRSRHSQQGSDAILDEAGAQRELAIHQSASKFAVHLGRTDPSDHLLGRMLCGGQVSRIRCCISTCIHTSERRSLLLPHQSSSVTHGFPNPHRVLLIHGAAVTDSVWAAVSRELAGVGISTPQRRCTGSLDDEIGDLAPLCDGALVVGVSGGATLGLELVARGFAHHGAVLHEPAVGSLLPGLLTPVAEAFASGGVEEFARTLYGQTWSPHLAPEESDCVARDLAMFRTFEPSAPLSEPRHTLITVGESSPQIRHDAARLLAERFGFRVAVVPGARHAVHLEQPAAFAQIIRRELAVDQP